MLKKTSDIGGKGHEVIPSNIISDRNASGKEAKKMEIKGWRAIPIRDPNLLKYNHENITADKNQQKEQKADALKKREDNNNEKEGWKAIKMIDPKTLRNETESMTFKDRGHINRQNRKRKIRRKRIKRKRKKGRKQPRRKRKHKRKGCRKKVWVKGKRICVKKRCTVAWCKNRNLRFLQEKSPHKYNYWGQNVTTI